MKKGLFLGLLFAVFFSVPLALHAQVTIGSATAPNPNAILDLKENQDGTSTRGLLLPRVNLVSETYAYPMVNHVAGMVVYNLATSDDSVAPADAVRPGVYHNTGERWERLRGGQREWFYMPSMVFDLTQPTIEKDLFGEFYSQFSDIPVEHRSPGAPSFFKDVLSATDFYYYVTGFDTDVFSNINVTAEGILTADVNTGAVSERTFMNIVFVLR